MGKSKKTSSSQEQSFGTRTDIDFGSQEYRDFLRQQGREGVAVANDPRQDFFTGPHSAQEAALAQLQGQSDVQGASIGFAPGQMDPNRAQDFFNPYQQHVIGAIQQNADRQRAMAGEQAGFASAGQGFGVGSRQAVAEQLANRDIGQNELAQIAQASQQGYGQAQGLAANEYGQMQNLGFGVGQANQYAQMQAALANQNFGLQSANQQFNMGSQLQQLQQQQAQEPLWRQQQALAFAQGAMGPTGQVSSGHSSGKSTTEQKGNLFGDILGIAGTIGGALIPGAGPAASMIPAAPGPIAAPAAPSVGTMNFGFPIPALQQPGY